MSWERGIGDDIIYFTVTSKTQKFKVDKFAFEVTWDSKQNYSTNIGYYGGIKTLKIYTNNQLLNTIENIEDAIALGEIYLNFYDFNFDGYLDFSVPIDSGKSISRKYYLFNKEMNQFKYYKEWDYIRFDEINKSKKQIKSNYSYNASQGVIYKYQVSGYKLVELEKVEY